MLCRIEIQNFKCLRDVKVALSPLTVLVGPNGSGKSTLLQALDPHVSDPGRLIWQHDFTMRVQVIAEMSAGDRMEWSYERDRTPEPFEHQGTTFRYQFLRLDLSKMRQPNQVREERTLSPDGSNLTNFIGTLTRKQRDELAQDLCQAVPLFQDVDVRASNLIGSGNHVLWFQDRWNDEVWYRPDEVSDGTMLTLAFLALRFQIQPPDVLAIEEPERGLHPYMLADLVKLLRGMTQGALGGPPVQIVLATHSAELLDQAEPDEVRFMRRDHGDGSVTVERAQTGSDDWRKTYEVYQESLGSIWLSGGLGGVPGAA